MKGIKICKGEENKREYMVRRRKDKNVIEGHKCSNLEHEKK